MNHIIEIPAPQHFLEKIKILLDFCQHAMYNHSCCGMIAVKREVAARRGRFSVERMSS
jgi:hypothetical protein